MRVSKYLLCLSEQAQHLVHAQWSKTQFTEGKKKEKRKGEKKNEQMNDLAAASCSYNCAYI